VLQAKVERYKTVSANSTTEVCNMFRISRMQEILKGLPKGNFDALVREHRADKYSKNFSCWDQLVVMVYAQLAGATSLRQLEAGYNSQRTHHYHLGTGELRRSTLADANARRTPQLFAQVAQGLMAQAKRSLRQEGQQLLYLLDSTSITLKGPGFDGWTLQTSTRNTQGIKLHMLYGAHEQAPLSCDFSPANVNDVEQGAKIAIEPGATYVFDKGYCNYNWWARFDASGAWFVTRFKSNASLRELREMPIPPKAAGVILADHLVSFKNRHPRGGRRNDYTAPLRRIQVAREGHAAPLVLATNDLHTPALEIARRYKDRWQIELFFKWIKQHLGIKRFLGRSENAVRIQILIALIAYLLLALYRQANGLKTAMWTLLAEVRATLFQRPTVESELYRRRQHQKRAFAACQPGLFT
jgi:putative transposase